MRSNSLLLIVMACATLVQAEEKISATRNALVATNDPLGEPVTNIVYLNQNWSPEESNRFYFTPQGSQLIPYDWFLALEQYDSTTLFRDN
jgi:hypothetical protein